MKRILQMGGHVTPAGANGSPSRVWHNLRGLAMARSIGDHHAATVGVIADPEITEYDLVDEDMALIIASDGVWDHWAFDESMGALCDLEAPPGQPLTTRQRILDFFEETRAKGEDAFGDGADNLTGIVAVFPAPVERDTGNFGA